MTLEHVPNSADSERHGLARIAVPLVLFVIAIGCLTIDIPTARLAHWCFEHHGYAKPIFECLDRAEAFGHAFGALLVITTVVLLDPRMRYRWGWIAGGTFGAGLLANAIKLVVVRTRPRASDLIDGSVWQTFQGWIQRESSSGKQSFPSGHTATAVGLAVVLAGLYPRGKWLFATMATLVGLHRIFHSAHFPSDVFAAAGIGWLIGSCCLYGDSRRLNRADSSDQLSV